MNATARRERPSWPRLVGIQFRLILGSGRWVELIGGIIALLGLALLWASVTSTAPGSESLVRSAQGPWVVLTLPFVSVWPALVWRGASPAQRRSHWSLPVPRGPHDLARVAAGGIWVLLAAVLVAVVRFLFARPSVPSVFLWSAASYACAIVTLYSVASISAVATAHPSRWFFGVLIACALILPNLGDANNPWGGQFGFLPATLLNVVPMTVVETLDDAAKTDSAQTFAATTRIGPERTGAASAKPEVGETVVQERERVQFSPQDGLLASGLWIAGAIAVLLAISASQHEH